MFRDVVKKTVSGSVGRALKTEETVRGLVGEMKLPKEAVSYIVTTADTIKTEIVRVAAQEFREFLESANLGEEIAKILTSLSFEIRTEVRFIPNEEAVKPNVKSRVALKGAEDNEILATGADTEQLDEAIRVGVSSITDRLKRRRKASSSKERSADDEKAEAAEETEPEPEPAKKPAPKRRRSSTSRSSSSKSKSSTSRASGSTSSSKRSTSTKSTAKKTTTKSSSTRSKKADDE